MLNLAMLKIGVVIFILTVSLFYPYFSYADSIFYSEVHKTERVGLGFSSETATIFSKDYGRLLLLDTEYTLSRPMQWEAAEWEKFSLYMAGIGSILLLDDEIYDGIQRNRTEATSDVARVVEEFGSFPSFGIMGAFYVGGALLDNYKAKTVAMDAFAASFISAGLITSSLKVIAGRSRPDEGDGTYRFQPFGGHNSFPSGHTTQAFSLASVIAGHYDEWWIDSLAYGIAGGVGLARIEQEAHFPSDVVAGAIIGTVVGKTIVRYNSKFHKNVTIEPAADIEGAGLSLKIVF
jgi:membrane-associated phospholipid phosphatase